MLSAKSGTNLRTLNSMECQSSGLRTRLREASAGKAAEGGQTSGVGTQEGVLAPSDVTVSTE